MQKEFSMGIAGVWAFCFFMGPHYTMLPLKMWEGGLFYIKLMNENKCFSIHFDTLNVKKNFLQRTGILFIVK